MVHDPGFSANPATDNLGHPAKECSKGFALVELMMALLIVMIGLLAVGQPVYTALSSASLARSKSIAALVAQNKLEQLGALLLRNPDAGDLTPGTHGPEQVRIEDPADGTVLNCFSVDWGVGMVTDPRPGRTSSARQITITVTPVDSVGVANKQPNLNKAVVVSSIYCGRTS
jgi:type II secretory pathway pseudopilin PulG